MVRERTAPHRTAATRRRTRGAHLVGGELAVAVEVGVAHVLAEAHDGRARGHARLVERDDDRRECNRLQAVPDGARARRGLDENHRADRRDRLGVQALRPRNGRRREAARLARRAARAGHAPRRGLLRVVVDQREQLVEGELVVAIAVNPLDKRVDTREQVA